MKEMAADRLNTLSTMSRRVSLYAFACVIVAAAILSQVMGRPQASPQRLTDSSFADVEEKTGRQLVAPTWLPSGMQPVRDGTVIGAFRVLSNYEEPGTQRLLILAQEPRDPKRDAYHETWIIPRTDLGASVGTNAAYFMQGRSGERRLFWKTPDGWHVLSSHALTDDELLRIARSVR